MDTNTRWTIGGAVVGAVVSVCHHLIFKQDDVTYGADIALIAGSTIGVFIGSILGSTPANDRRAAFIDIVGTGASVMVFQWLLNSLWTVDSSDHPDFVIRFVRWVIPVVLGLFVYYKLRPRWKLKL